jgi:large subunit ribosomal protein L24
MMKSKKPNKQRKAFYNADLHTRHKFVSAHLSPELRAKWKKRSLPLRKGDEVKVTTGSFKGTTGKISRIDVRRVKAYMENIKRKKVSGEEVYVPVHPSNLMIMNPVMEDKMRVNVVNRKGEKIGKAKKTDNS